MSEDSEMVGKVDLEVTIKDLEGMTTTERASSKAAGVIPEDRSPGGPESVDDESKERVKRRTLE